MIHWGFFVALIVACLVFDAFVYRIAFRRGYKAGRISDHDKALARAAVSPTALLRRLKVFGANK